MANAAPQSTMPMVRIGKHMVSRLIMGINTLGGIGASRVSRMIDLEMTAWYKPETASTSTTQKPEVFTISESEGWDVDYYLTCLCKYGRTQAESSEEAVLRLRSSSLAIGMFNKHEYKYAINRKFKHSPDGRIVLLLQRRLVFDPHEPPPQGRLIVHYPPF